MHALFIVFIDVDTQKMSDDREKRVRKPNSQVYNDTSVCTSSTKRRSDQAITQKPTTGRFTSDDSQFISNWFFTNDIGVSFEFTQEWANDKVFPAFKDHLSLKRRESVFTDFSGWVLARLNIYKSSLNPLNASEFNNNLQTRSVSTVLDDNAISKPIPTNRSRDRERLRKRQEREAKLEQKQKELEARAKRGELVRKRREEKKVAEELRLCNHIQKTSDFLKSSETVDLSDSIIIFESNYEAAKKCFLTAKSLRIKLSQNPCESRCASHILSLTKLMDGLVRKCSLCTEDWVTTFYDAAKAVNVVVADDSDHESNCAVDDADVDGSEMDSDDEDLNKTKIDEENTRERKRKLRRIHTSQNQLAAKLVKLGSDMLELPLERTSSQSHKMDTMLQCDDNALQFCDNKIAEHSKKLLEYVRQRSKMIPVANDSSKCVSLTFGTTPNDGTYQIHSNAPRDTLLHSLFEAKYVCQSEEIKFDLLAGMTVQKPFRTIDRNLSRNNS